MRFLKKYLKKQTVKKTFKAKTIGKVGICPPLPLFICKRIRSITRFGLYIFKPCFPLPGKISGGAHGDRSLYLKWIDEWVSVWMVVHNF